MKNTSIDISRISKKIMGNNIKLNPVVPMEKIRRFEHDNGIVLPEELVRFYTEIGNGGKMLFGCELRKFEEWDYDKEKIGKEFPFKECWIWEDDDNPDDNMMQKISNGNIELMDIGDAQYWNIIVRGEKQGQMWNFLDVGIQPCAPERGFLSWYEYWLDGNDDYFSDYANS